MRSPSPAPISRYSAQAKPPQESTVVVLPVVNAFPRPRLAIVPTPIRPHAWLVFAAGAFLVSVPVFFEAPLVRYFPWVSLVLSLGWALLSVVLCRQRQTAIWGDLLVGFTWTWLCGAIFWGWLRWEPVWHIPVEAAALPIALLGLRFCWAKVGNCFYLGSLLGTAITDIYFYLVGLIPAWKQLMQIDPLQAGAVFQGALAKMYMPWGMAWAAMLAASLLFVGLWAIKQRSAQWMAFGGAVLSTLLVDGLFWVAAALA